MPHDAHNKVLSVGDVVFVPARITKIFTGEDYCNAEIETLFGRRPDGLKEKWSAFNTAVLVRARPEDGPTVSCVPEQETK